jgi:hypothetical protein
MARSLRLQLSDAYRFFPGGGAERDEGIVELNGCGGTFFGCFGFFASLLPRCTPLGIWISLVFAGF